MCVKITGSLLAGVVFGLLALPTHASAESKTVSVVCPGKGCKCTQAIFCDVHPDGTEFNCHYGTYCTVTASGGKKEVVVSGGGKRTINLPTANLPLKMR